MSKEHFYEANLVWTGNSGEGTKSYTAYSRAHEISIEGKPLIAGSSDPHFRGDASRYNPEELLVASLSACHMLWYLHLCADAGIIVTGYTDAAKGEMIETPDGSGYFTSVTLDPQVTVTRGSDLEAAQNLHHEAHIKCFIANSVNFPIQIKGRVTIETKAEGRGN